MTQIDVDQSEWTPPASARSVRPSHAIAKRAVDVAGATFGLLFFAPLLLLVALGAMLLQGRPVLYSHRRIGRGGRSFGCLKFRSMVANGDAVLAAHLDADPAARREWAETRKLQDDPRVGCFGHLLRRSSLDELPQLWNVLRGDMSLVGPRPIVEAERQHYGLHIDAYESVRPGLTGVWQVSGRSDTTYPERVAMDVDYVRDRTLRRDFGIMLLTVVVLLTGRGAR